MRVMFVGNLEGHTSIERRNIERLARSLAASGVALAVRWPKQLGPSVPIDFVVCSALQGHCDGVDLLVVREPGADSPDPIPLHHHPYTAAAKTRIEFYKQILHQVDVVIGVGGNTGLLRMAMLAEYQGKTAFPLPGTGGAAADLWAEFFVKSTQAALLSEAEAQRVQSCPYANVDDSNYGLKVWALVQLVDARVRSRGLPVGDPEDLSLLQALQLAGHLPLKIWFWLVAVLTTVAGAAYHIGSQRLLRGLIE